MVRPSLIDINHVELKHYPFMISLNKFTVSCNVLSLKICVPKEKIYIYVNPFCGSGRAYNVPSEKSCKLMVFEILTFDFYLEKIKGTVNYCLFERKHIIMKK